MKRCIVLDCNGVLWKKERFGVKYFKGVHKFIDDCLRNFDYIAFYTSTTEKNAKHPLLSILLKHRNIRSKVLFIWYRDKCEQHPVKKEYFTYKPIKKIEVEYKNINFVLVDDDQDKMWSNLKEDYVIFSNYDDVICEAKNKFEEKEVIYGFGDVFKL